MSLVDQRRRAAVTLARQDPLIRSAFEAWTSNSAYWDGRGYRLQIDKRRRAPWSAAVCALYPDVEAFAESARLYIDAQNR